MTETTKTASVTPVVDEGADLLTSGEVADALGVGPSTVKRWTDSGELKCVKTLGRHRRFARAEVESFAQRNGLMTIGLGRRDIARSATTGALDGSPASASSAAPADAQTDRWLEVLTGTSGAYSVQAALLSERATHGAWWRVAERMGQVLDAVGRRWAEGSLSVVQEHLASERLQRAIIMLTESLIVRDNAPRCLLATAENDEHTLGLSLLELVLREADWHTRWLGRRTPIDEIIRFVAERGIEMVALSASATSNDAAALAREAERVGAACKQHDVVLLLGGTGAWPDAPSYGYRTRSFAELHRLLQQTDR